MDQAIVELIARGGYVGIFLLMAIENIIPPIPSELIMGLGGVLVERGQMAFWPLLIAGTAGSTAGNYVMFWFAHRYGYRRLEPLVARWGRWLTVEWEDIERGQRFFIRHGHWVVFALRFSPFLRSVISIPAGLAHMPHGRFLAYTAAGAAIWNVALISGGQLLGRFLAQSQDVLGWLILGGLALLLAVYGWRVVHWRPRDQRRSDDEAAPGDEG